MFLIAGILPKTTLIDKKPRLCPVCGLAQAHYKRIDHYFSLFFIPLFRVKKGEAILICDKCEQEVKEFGFGESCSSGEEEKSCNNCGKKLKGYFVFCPYCGKAV
ncbi:MAG: zinc ribbon domain-containing protein [Proteobacteria bacterium]|nr:zinc ribbon domain-containing protein [Pseudomonadota bacterium]